MAFMNVVSRPPATGRLLPLGLRLSVVDGVAYTWSAAVDWVRPGTLLGELDRALNLFLNFVIDRLKLTSVGDGLLLEELAEPRDRAARFPKLHFLARPIGVVAHPFRVRTGPVSLALDQGRAAACPGPLHGLAPRLETASTSLPSTSTPGSP